MCGAVISMINGFGRRTQKAQRKAGHVTALVSRESQSVEASAANLGY
jgi:phosphoribosylaminoimidazole carboxylase (NCAIR synthetase)